MKAMKITLILCVLFGSTVAFAGSVSNTGVWQTRAAELILGNKEWYAGGSLHKADTAQWSRASFSNKMATAADFYTKMNAKEVMQRGMGMKGLGAGAFGLVVCIDTAIEGVKMPSIAEVAALCQLIME